MKFPRESSTSEESDPSSIGDCGEYKAKVTGRSKIRRILVDDHPSGTSANPDERITREHREGINRNARGFLYNL